MSLKYEPLRKKTTNPSSTATNTPQPLSPNPEQDMPVLKSAVTEHAPVLRTALFMLFFILHSYKA